MAEFVSLDKDLPRKMVTQGLEIYFKYTGQPMTCYRCGSSEHMVKSCPKQRSRFQHIRVEERILPGPPNPPEPQDSAMETTVASSENSTGEALSSTPLLFSTPASGDNPSQPQSFASVTASCPDPSLTSASRELFESRKRPPPPRPRKKLRNPRPKDNA